MKSPWRNRLDEGLFAFGTLNANHERASLMPNVIVLQPLGALIAGILILIIPRLLNFIVAIYLILIGILGLAPHFMR